MILDIVVTAGFLAFYWVGGYYVSLKVLSGEGQIYEKQTKSFIYFSCVQILYWVSIVVLCYCIPILKKAISLLSALILTFLTWPISSFIVFIKFLLLDKQEYMAHKELQKISRISFILSIIHLVTFIILIVLVLIFAHLLKNSSRLDEYREQEPIIEEIV